MSQASHVRLGSNRPRLRTVSAGDRRDESLSPDGTEIQEARWFTRDELSEYGNAASLGCRWYRILVAEPILPPR